MKTRKFTKSPKKKVNIYHNKKKIPIVIGKAVVQQNTAKVCNLLCLGTNKGAN